jgi:hypothetical protein
MLKLLGPEGMKWSYQSKVMGGRKQPGGAVPDFLYRETNTIFRVQTERYHIAVPHYTQFKDREQYRAVSRAGFKVIDIYEEHFIGDATGQQAIAVTWDAIKGEQRPSPLANRTSRARG